MDPNNFVVLGKSARKLSGDIGDIIFYLISIMLSISQKTVIFSSS